VDFAEGSGEVGCYCSCEHGIKHQSSVKNVRNCLSSQPSDHYCLKKDSAAQGLDRYLLFYYFVVKCIVALGTHSVKVRTANCFVCCSAHHNYKY
jgi:hypothetical protein